MAELNKKPEHACSDCEHFLRMYKGAGVGTCKRGSKKYRSEEALCDLNQNITQIDADSLTSGYVCYNCGEDIITDDFNEECSIGPFDSDGKLIHYYCSDCWEKIHLDREKVRRKFEVP